MEVVLSGGPKGGEKVTMTPHTDPTNPQVIGIYKMEVVPPATKAGTYELRKHEAEDGAVTNTAVWVGYR